MEKENTINSLLWVVAGAAIGLGIGVLVAPKRGDEVREDVSHSAAEKLEGITSRGRELIGRGREVYERGRHIADEAADLFERSKRLIRG